MIKRYYICSINHKKQIEMRKSNYVSVGKNIYRDGSSYRVRVSVNGERQSRNCSSKREAVKVRNEMISER